MSPGSLDLDVLKIRADLFRAARAFFDARGIMEVDCPALCGGVIVDANIDPISVLHQKNPYFLHTSPEAGMKKLLSSGVGDIYQISHVFREGEISAIHHPEFTMVEWYRKYLSFETFIEETLDFMRLFLGDLTSHTLSYRDAFILFSGQDPFQASITDLLHAAKSHELRPPEKIKEDRNALLDFILAFLIEPCLGTNALTVIRDYPPDQAALAQLIEKEERVVAERFEIYFKGIELCNGYHELGDLSELKNRFESENKIRKEIGKEVLPMDEEFLQNKIPECCGVAVGFDRLMMLKTQKNQISEVMPTSPIFERSGSSCPC